MSNLEGQGNEAGRPRFSVKIDDQTFTLTNSAPTGRELLALVGRSPDDFFLVFLVPGEPDQIVELDEPFDLSGPGTEKFVLVSRARRFAIQVDETTHTVVGPLISGAQILELAGKDPDTHFVTQIIVGEGDIVIDPEDQVDISEPGRERFTVVLNPAGACKIIVNTRSYPWDRRSITFEDVVKLAYPDHAQDDPNTTIYTVKYRCGDASDPEGTLVAGERLKVRCGMVFDVDRTNRS